MNTTLIEILLSGLILSICSAIVGYLHSKTQPRILLILYRDLDCSYVIAKYTSHILAYILALSVGTVLLLGGISILLVKLYS